MDNQCLSDKTMKLIEMKGYNLKRAREAAGLRQDDVIEKLDITLGTIKNYENGRTEVPASKLIIMCELYGCTLDELLRPNEKCIKSKALEARMKRIDTLPEYDKAKILSVVDALIMQASNDDLKRESGS